MRRERVVRGAETTSVFPGMTSCFFPGGRRVSLFALYISSRVFIYLKNWRAGAGRSPAETMRLLEDDGAVGSRMMERWASVGGRESSPWIGTNHTQGHHTPWMTTRTHASDFSKYEGKWQLLHQQSRGYDTGVLRILREITAFPPTLARI